ncbi:MAG: hypothetical protein RLY20_408 [Verrucomicrobiota bacterium]|jgi:ABC-type nitrate/sulfonate/bicarbonate transport system substrate-binding protein
MKKVLPFVRVMSQSAPIRLGFVPVNDCAPLVVAQEKGLFAKYDLQVELKRKQTWSAIRDSITEHALEAAMAPAPLPVTMTLGLNAEFCMSVVSMVLSLSGNAITLSRKLWREGGHEPFGLMSRARRKPWLTFAVPSTETVQSIFLQQWLRTAGLEGDARIRIITLSPAEMFPNLKLGYIDGFCSDEPWNSLAIRAGVGVCVATSSHLSPMHPEKVLMVRETFAESRPSEHERLTAALIEACDYCGQPKHRRTIAKILSRREYVNAPMEALEAGLVGPFSTWNGNANHPLGLNVFSRHLAGEPNRAKMNWVLDRLCAPPPMGRSLVKEPLRQLARDIFRPDIFRRAQRLVAMRSSSATQSPSQEALTFREALVA